MSVHQEKQFEFEMFTRNGGRLAAIVTVKGSATDVAYIRPDGTVNWTQYGDMYSTDGEAMAEVERVQNMIKAQNAA